MQRRAAIEHAGNQGIQTYRSGRSLALFLPLGDTHVKALLGPGWPDVGLFGQLL